MGEKVQRTAMGGTAGLVSDRRARLKYIISRARVTTLAKSPFSDRRVKLMIGAQATLAFALWIPIGRTPEMAPRTKTSKHKLEVNSGPQK